MTASNIIAVFNIIHEAVLELFKCRGQSSAGSIKYVAKKTTICHSQDRIFPWMTNSDEVLPCFAVTFLSSSKCFICLKWWWPSVWKWYFVTKIVLTYCEKKCSSDREKLLKFEAEGREFAKFLRSLEQFIQTVEV